MATGNPFKSETFRFVLFGIFILATRLPFMGYGFGTDSDAWGVALTAKSIAVNGEYDVSRFPGFPFQEIMLSLIYKGGSFLFNLVTALMSVAGVIFFALMLRKLRFKYVFLAGTALAFVPAIYVNSSNSMDYMWAFAFIMGSMYFIVSGRLLLAGVMLGLAIGCRITSGAMLLPFTIMLALSDRSERSIRHVMTLILTALIVGCLCYVPVFLKYGWGFFTYYDVPYPLVSKVLYKFTFSLWGVLGFFGICCGLLIFFAPTPARARQYLFPRSVNINYVLPWLIAIDLYIISYIVLPMDSGYLIPIVPFVILIFGKYLFDKAFIFFAWTLVLSPFVGGISPLDRVDSPKDLTFETACLDLNGERLAFDPITGPVVLHYLQRQNGETFVKEVIAAADTVKSKAIIVAGKWYNQVTYQWDKPADYHVRFAFYLMHDEMHDLMDRGYKIYYLPQADDLTKLKAGFNLADDGAKLLVQK